MGEPYETSVSEYNAEAETISNYKSMPTSQSMQVPKLPSTTTLTYPTKKYLHSIWKQRINSTLKKYFTLTTS